MSCVYQMIKIGRDALPDSWGMTEFAMADSVRNDSQLTDSAEMTRMEMKVPPWSNLVWKSGGGKAHWFSQVCKKLFYTAQIAHIRLTDIRPMSTSYIGPPWCERVCTSAKVLPRRRPFMSRWRTLDKAVSFLPSPLCACTLSTDGLCPLWMNTEVII